MPPDVPEAGGGGEPLDPLTTGDNNCASSDKADSGHYLGPQAGNICIIAHVHIEILACQSSDGGTQADQNMGAEAGWTAFILSLDADDSTTERSQQHTQSDREQGDITQFMKYG